MTGIEITRSTDIAGSVFSTAQQLVEAENGRINAYNFSRLGFEVNIDLYLRMELMKIRT
jgi:hypothetical protein